MFVKELPENSNLANIKVQLPEKVLEQYQAYCGGDAQMWIVGSMMGDWFLSPNPPNIKGERRLYPMPIGIEPSNILEWEIVENLN